MSPTSAVGLRRQRIIFIRHGQAEHNLLSAAGKRDQGRQLLDPVLTDLGRRQAGMLKSNAVITSAFADETNAPQLLVASPLRRTLQTAYLGFGARLPVALNADIQETNVHPCDRGDPESGRALLSAAEGESAEARAMFLAQYDQLPTDWNKKTPDFGERAAILARFERFLRWCAERPEDNMIVVARALPLAARICTASAICPPHALLTHSLAWQTITFSRPRSTSTSRTASASPSLWRVAVSPSARLPASRRRSNGRASYCECAVTE